MIIEKYKTWYQYCKEIIHKILRMSWSNKGTSDIIMSKHECAKQTAKNKTCPIIYVQLINGLVWFDPISWIFIQLNLLINQPMRKMTFLWKQISRKIHYISHFSTSLKIQRHHSSSIDVYILIDVIEKENVWFIVFVHNPVIVLVVKYRFQYRFEPIGLT